MQDEEIQVAKVQDAGEFLLRLRSGGEYSEFVKQHERSEGQGPRQHIARCVEHLMAFIVRIVQMDYSRDLRQEHALTADEAKQFMCSGASGREVMSLSTTKDMRAALLSSSLVAHGMLFKRLRQVELFKGLEDSDLKLLQQNMVSAPYQMDANVIVQGAVGNAFFIITKGTADVIWFDDKDESERQVERVIKKLVDYDYFGERALLRKEPRFATVRATSVLQTVYLTQDGFRQALGKPLTEFLASHNDVSESVALFS